MLNDYPLKETAVVVTGSSVTTSILQKIDQLGGEAISCPLIKTVEVVKPYDHIKLEMARNYHWLIFTSQNAVDSFCAKMVRHNLTSSNFKVKIAAVGSKTRKKLEENGFRVDFIPSIYSADVFVKEFPNIAGQNSRCLFIRGKKAKNTIKAGLPHLVSEWNVYETTDNITHIQNLLNIIHHRKKIIIIFASPSAVDVFAQHIASKIGWGKAKIASIGHITSNALLKHGAQVTYQPKTYTMEAVLEEIIH